MTDENDLETVDISEVSDLILGFQYHDEEQHWHAAAYLMPDSFTDQQAEQLENLAEEFAQRLTQAGLSLPPEQ